MLVEKMNPRCVMLLARRRKKICMRVLLDANSCLTNDLVFKYKSIFKYHCVSGIPNLVDNSCNLNDIVVIFRGNHMVKPLSSICVRLIRYANR